MGEGGLVLLAGNEAISDLTRLRIAEDAIPVLDPLDLIIHTLDSYWAGRSTDCAANLYFIPAIPSVADLMACPASFGEDGAEYDATRVAPIIFECGFCRSWRRSVPRTQAQLVEGRG